MMSGIWKTAVVLVAVVAIGCTEDAAKLPQTDPASEIANYSNRMQGSLELISVNLAELGQLLTNPLPDDDAWHSEVGERLEMLIKARDEAATMLPPPELRDAHKSLMEALGLYAEGAELSLTGLETGASELLILAASKFDTAGSFIALATLQIKDAGKEEPSAFRGR